MAAGEDELGTQAKEYIDQGKKVILYCTKGIFSKEAAEKLAEEGIDVLSLEGGYTGWLISLMKEEQENDQKTEQNNKEAEGKGKKKELTRTQEIEKSIRKKFHKQIFSKFVKAIKTYDLVQENDKIAICISGGKDSMLMAKLFQELKRHNKFHFDLVFLVMDPGYNEMNRQIILKRRARTHGIVYKFVFGCWPRGIFQFGSQFKCPIHSCKFFNLFYKCFSNGLSS